jgi:hypothetical protein
MKVRTILPSFIVMAAFVLAAPAVGDDAAHSSQAAIHPGLDRFKHLAGDWVGKMSDDGKEWHDATAKYTVTSAGTAVVETLGPGTMHEMVTIIHPDGKALGLTHYCAIGNQPHMKADVKGDGKKVEFVFVSATNMKSEKDMHMHSVTFTFVDDDTLQTVWTNYDDGKKAGTATFDLKRKK